MKKFSLALLALLAGTGAFAQKSNININGLYFTCNYREIPTMPQVPLFFDYGVTVEAPASVRAVYDQAKLAEMIRIDGQNKIGEPAAEGYLITAKFPELVVESTKTWKDGASIYMDISYKFECKLQLSQNGAAMVTTTNTTYEGASNKFTIPQAFKSEGEAAAYWVNNSALVKNQIIKKEVDTAIAGARKTMSRRYGFYDDNGKVTVELKTAKVGSHPESGMIDKMAVSLKSKLEKLDATTPLSESDLAKELAYFKALPERFASTDPKNKGDLKIRYLAYHNLCRAYFLLDRPDDVVVWADKLIANGQSPKDGTRFKEMAAKLLADLNRTVLKTRHFNPEVVRKQLQ